MAQRPCPCLNRRNLPRTILIPSNIPIKFQTKKSTTIIYIRQARGQLYTAKAQSHLAIAQNDRVKPQNGHGYPVSTRKVHRFKGKRWRGTKVDSNSAIPATRAAGKCDPTTSQYETGRVQEKKRTDVSPPPPFSEKSASICGPSTEPIGND